MAKKLLLNERNGKIFRTNLNFKNPLRKLLKIFSRVMKKLAFVYAISIHLNSINYPFSLKIAIFPIMSRA